MSPKNCPVYFPQEHRQETCHQNFTTFFTLMFTLSKEFVTLCSLWGQSRASFVRQLSWQFLDVPFSLSPFGFNHIAEWLACNMWQPQSRSQAREHWRATSNDQTSNEVLHASASLCWNRQLSTLSRAPSFSKPLSFEIENHFIPATVIARSSQKMSRITIRTEMITNENLEILFCFRFRNGKASKFLKFFFRICFRNDQI